MSARLMSTHEDHDEDDRLPPGYWLAEGPPRDDPEDDAEEVPDELPEVVT